MKDTTSSVWLKAAGLILWIALMGALAWLAMAKGWFEPQRLQHFLERLGPFAPLAFMGLMALAVVSTSLPTIVLDIAAGIIFGPIMGTLYAVIGAEVGALIAFFVARRLGRDAMTRMLKKDISFCDRCARRQLPTIIFLTRLIPVFNFDLVSYGAGLTAIPLPAYALATFLGMIPPTFIFVTYGQSVIAHLHPVVTMLLALVMVALFFLVPIWIKRKNPFGLHDRMKGEGPQ